MARAKADVLAHLVAGAPAHLKFVDQQHVAPLFRWQGGLLRQRHLEETQQDDADQFREVGPDHAARGTDQKVLHRAEITVVTSQKPARETAQKKLSIHRFTNTDHEP